MNVFARKDEFSLLVIPKIAATYIGTVVGAGFASGREIYQFFSIHQGGGWLGLIMAVMVLGYTGAKTFQIGAALQPSSYRDFFVYLLGKRLAAVADLILFVFLIILIGVMFAGCGAIFETMGLGYWTGIGLTGLGLIFILSGKLPGLIAVNLIVVPLMFIGSIGVALYTMSQGSVVHSPGVLNYNWFPAAWQFSAYNLILSLPVLLSLGKHYSQTRYLSLSGWMGSLILGLMAGLIHGAILMHLPYLQNAPLPMAVLAKFAGGWVYWGYALILWGEMFTTLLANTFGVAERLVSLTGFPFQVWVIVVVFVGISFGQIGFVNLIGTFYPLFGYLCLGILSFIVFKSSPKRLTKQ
ncbi:MAG TPA: hypothetical protein VHY08_15875 [Bacillota bacterium]|nr:hypothetical protein [Bacillota bacterium]